MGFLFREAGIIPSSAVWAGLMGNTTILFGSLFVVSAAMSDTKVLERYFYGGGIFDSLYGRASSKSRQASCVARVKQVATLGGRVMSSCGLGDWTRSIDFR